jgi:hypothetical protein
LSATLTKTDYGRKLVKPGELSACPTVADITRRHQWGKGWYGPRNELIWQFEQMCNLRSPFDDKDGAEDGGFLTAAGAVEYTTDTTPFDVLTEAMSSMELKHPYVDVYPRLGQNEKQIADFQKFLQGLLDTRMRQDNLQKYGINTLMTTGWLILYHAYSADFKERGGQPFDIRVMHPSNIYPKFDSRLKAQWVTTEEVITGATLRDDYSMYPGVAEYFDDEPNDSDFPENSTAYNVRNRTGGSIDTCEFTVITYYDHEYTALLLNGSSIGQAADFNPRLKKLKEKSVKGRYESVLWSSKDDGDDYKGVARHHLGGIPYSFNWCWPEIGDRFAQSGLRQSGRFLGMPFGFGMLENWRAISRILSMLSASMLMHADPDMKTTDPDLKREGKIIYAQGDVSYMTPPPMPPEAMHLLEELKAAMARSSISNTAYGAKAGTSGAQQEMIAEAGTSRYNTLTGELERNTTSMLKAVTYTMLERGDEEDLEVTGSGKAYGNKPYTMSYKISNLKGKCPEMVVTLKERDGLDNPNNVVKAVSLLKDGLLSQRTVMKEVLKIADPDAEIEQIKAEVIAKGNMQPAQDEALLEEILKRLKKTEGLKWEIENAKDEIELENKKRDIEREFSQLPEESKSQLMEQALQKILAEIAQQGQPPQQPPMPGMQAMPPGPPTSMMGQPGMPPMRPPMVQSMPGQPPGGMGQVAKAPFQAQQPMPPLSRQDAPGGISRPGVPSMIAPAQRAMPGQPQPSSPIAQANATMAPPMLPPLTLGRPRRNTGQGAAKRGGRRRRAGRS